MRFLAAVRRFSFMTVAPDDQSEKKIAQERKWCAARRRETPVSRGLSGLIRDYGESFRARIRQE
jgi:hypothetical protein